MRAPARESSKPWLATRLAIAPPALLGSARRGLLPAPLDPIHHDLDPDLLARVADSVHAWSRSR